MYVSVIIPFRPTHPARIASAAIVSESYQKTLTEAGIAHEIHYADDPDPQAFNKGRAINVGVNHAVGDVLVFADCDSIVEPANLLEAIKECPRYGMVVPFTCIQYLTRECTARWHKGERKVKEIESTFTKPSVGVCNVIHRARFAEVHGFDPRFRGWGYEDAALSMALSTLVGPVKWIPGDVTHLWHPIARNSQNPTQRASLEHCHVYGRTDNNFEAMRHLVDQIPQHCIRAGYRHRYTPPTTEGPNQDQLHKAVYRTAQSLAQERGVKSVVDIACGSAYKLRVNFKAYDRRGLDSEGKVAALKRRYPNERWDVATTASIAGITEELVLCVNVLEKLTWPDQLMALLANSSARYFAFATPDRDILRGVSDMGPPRNPAHCREWNMLEFKQFVDQWFAVVHQDLSDDSEGIQVVFAERRQ